MLKIRKSRTLALVASFVCVAFLNLVIAPDFLSSPAAAAANAAKRVAVLKVEDLSGLKGATVGTSVRDALTLALVRNADYDPIPEEDVKAGLANAGINSPYFDADFPRIADALGADAVIAPTVKSAVVTKDRAQVEVVCRIFDRHGPSVVRTIDVAAISAPNLKGDDSLRIASACREVGTEILSQLSQLLGMKGIVITRPSDTQVRISIGTDSGLARGARIAILKDDVPVGTATVTDVSTADSLATLDQPAKSGDVTVGAKVSVLANPNVASEAASENAFTSRSKSGTTKFLVALLVVGLAYLLFHGHGGGSSAAAPSTSRISAVASPTRLAADGTSTSTITATISDANGNPIANGTQVTFTTNLGTVTASATTANGQATATFIAGTTPGAATVTIKGAGLTQTVSITLTSTVSSPVTMTAQSQSIPANGSSSTVITATFRDNTNNPVPNGTVIDWTTTAGTLSTRAAGSRQNGVSTTTTDGVTSVLLTSPATPGTAVVTATQHGTSVQATITVNFTTEAVQVTASKSSIVADGNSISDITATVSDNTGNPVPDGTVVQFSTTLGSITARATTVGGIAKASLVSGTTVGTARVTVSVLDTNGKVVATNTDTIVAITAGPAALIAVGANPPNIRGLDVVGATASVRVNVRDANGNPVRDGTAVSLTTDKGTVQGSTTTVGGTATVTFYSNGAADGFNAPNPGIATITARTTTDQGVVLSAVTQIILSGAPNKITLTANPTTIPAGTTTQNANGTTTTTQGGTSLITADVRDVNNNFVVPNTAVQFSASLGTITGGGGTTDGLTASVVEATLQAGDQKGTAIVTARSGFAQASVNVTIN